MSIQIINEPQYGHEAMRILTNLYNGNSFEEVQYKNVWDKYGSAINAQELDRLTVAARALEQAVAPLVPHDEMAELLLRGSENMEPPANMFWLRHQWEQPRLQKALYQTIATFDALEDDDLFEDEGDFFAWLDGQPLQEQEKFLLLRVFHRYDALAVYYDELIAKVSLIIKAHTASFDGLRQDTMDEVQQRLDREGIGFLAHMGLVLDDNSEYVVYPLLSEANAVFLHTVGAGQQVALYIGCGFFDYVRMVEIAREHLRQPGDFCKILADPTKFSILQRLQGQPKYATQLAQELDLTAATISHHMSVLASNSLVTLHKQGNRIYYHRDEERLQGQLKLLADVLLGTDAAH